MEKEVETYPCGCPYDLARRSFINEIDKRMKLLKVYRQKYFNQLTPQENGANAGGWAQLNGLKKWLEIELAKEEKHRKVKI